jgi:hypothetical protein
MSADFWMGVTAGFAFLFTVTVGFIALSKRMSAEARKMSEATMVLLRQANLHREHIEKDLWRIARALEEKGGAK